MLTAIYVYNAMDQRDPVSPTVHQAAINATLMNPIEHGIYRLKKHITDIFNVRTAQHTVCTVLYKYVQSLYCTV